MRVRSLGKVSKSICRYSQRGFRRGDRSLVRFNPGTEAEIREPKASRFANVGIFLLGRSVTFLMCASRAKLPVNPFQL